MSCVGVLVGPGIGREISEAATAVLKQALVQTGATLEVISRRLTEQKHAKQLEEASEYYSLVRAREGAILRSSLHASVCYALRRSFGLAIKKVPIKAIPALVPIAPLRPETAILMDLLLLRDNNRGPYHGEFSYGDEAAGCSFTYEREHVRLVAVQAFAFARKRRNRVTLLLKESVLQSIGVLWRNEFVRAHDAWPDIEFDILAPDAGSAEILLTPTRFDIVVALDHDADLLADLLAAAVFGTRGLAASANVASDGFSTYQTLHGTGDSLKGKDCANPAGMMFAAAYLLEESFGLINAAELIRSAVVRTIADGLATADVARRLGGKCLGTAAFGEEVLERLGAVGVHA